MREYWDMTNLEAKDRRNIDPCGSKEAVEYKSQEDHIRGYLHAHFGAVTE